MGISFFRNVEKCWVGFNNIFSSYNENKSCTI